MAPPSSGTGEARARRKGQRVYLNLLVTALLVTLLLSACVPGTRGGRTFTLEQRPEFRPVTVAEAARALQFAELEFAFPAGASQREVDLSPLSGLILPAYQYAIPDMRFRASASGVSADADYIQIYHWNLRPLRFESLRPGDLVFYTDGSALVSGAGMFAGWKERNLSFQMLVADPSESAASYVEWDLAEEAERQLVAVGRLFIAAPRHF